jgi:hypothetical protein
MFVASHSAVEMIGFVGIGSFESDWHTEQVVFDVLPSVRKVTVVSA